MSTPFLVKDINPGSFGSFLGYLTALGNTLYFQAQDDVNGTELWKSDGTAAGTVLVKDIRPSFFGSNPSNLTAVGNTLFFTASDGVNGEELWKSNGTAAGTVLVKDIFPGSFGPSPRYLTAVGNTLFFTADDNDDGEKLWKSDGTAAGTVLVKNIRPYNLTAVGSTLFFRADDDVNGWELWKSDGTAAGTVLVKDIWPSFFGSFPRYLTAVGNTLFFNAYDDVNGGELWKSDGTAAGTVLVKDILPGSFGSFPRYLTAVGNTLFFTANDGVNGRELWKSDGTAAGTVLVRDIRAGSSSSNLENLTAVGNTLFFTAFDGVNGEELWKSDGTAAGTVLVKDIRPGSFSGSYPRYLTAAGSTLFFTANDGVNGYELWRSDGTAAGTVLVGDIRPGSSSSNPRNLRVVGNNLFFSADNGVNGTELWAVSTLAIPTLAIAATNANQTEGNSGSKAFTFTVTRSANTTGSNNVNWAVTGSGTNPANATDFVGSVLPSGTVSFAAGESSKVITFNVQGDTTFEPDENFTVTLSNATNGATITTATAIGTIQNDDTSVTPIETFGNTKLVQDTTNNLYAQIGNNNPIAITIGGTQITTNIYPGWQTLAAENVNGVNQVLWKYNDGNYLHLWSLDSNWNWQSSTGWWGLNSSEAFTQETNFQQDFNGDGIIGQPYTPIETFGNTKLVQDTTNNLYAQIGNNNPIAITIGGTQITTNIYPGWQTLAAETVNGVNQILWKYNDGNYLHLWSLDSNWNWQSSTGWWGLNSSEAFTQETDFQQDFNGDGIIGQPYTPIETFGNTKLVQDTTNNLYAQIGNNNPIAITIGGTQITTNIYPGWQTLAAETVNGVNQVLWKYNDGNYLHLWSLDSNWNWQSSTGWWDLNSPEAFTQETNFQQDFNGDNQIGNPSPSSLVGGLGNDILVGGAGNDTLNGAAGIDTLTGGTGTDIFIFQFGQSTAAALDRVTDFAIGDDKIDLLSQAGAAINAPVAFTRATDSTTTNINTIVTNVFTDADGATAGNQALGINSAVLVRDNSSSTYLIINDGTAGFQSANDLVINLTGLTGTLPALGTIAVNSFFV